MLPKNKNEQTTLTPKQQSEIKMVVAKENWVVSSYSFSLL
jgi:hypothetical protein